MDCAIITGADNPIGQAISRRIVDMGYRVYGLGQFKKDSAFEHRQFHPLGCDITQPAEMAEALEKVTQDKQVVSLLVHAASFSIDPKQDPPLFSDVEPGAIEALLRIQFLGPLLLTRMLLPQLKQGSGHILFLTPQSESLFQLNPARTASVSAIRHFSERLFDQERDNGLRVTSLILQPNPVEKGNRDKNAASGGQELINPKQVAEAAEQVLRTANEGNVITEYVLRPQIQTGSNAVPKTRAAIDPYREIMLPPSEHFPKEPVPLVIPQPPSTSQTISPEELAKTPLPEGAKEKQNQGNASSNSRSRRNRGRRGNSRKPSEQEDSRPKDSQSKDNQPKDNQSKDSEPKQNADSQSPPKKARRRRASKKSSGSEKSDSSKKKSSAEQPADSPKSGPPKKKKSAAKKSAGKKSAPKKKRASHKHSRGAKKKSQEQ